MLCVAGEVVNFLWVVLQVIQFLDWLGRRGKKSDDLGDFARFLDPADLSHGRSLLGSIHVLVIRFQRFEVSDIAVSVVANTADDVVPLVHAVASAIDVTPRFGQLFAEESATLDVVRNRQSGKVQDGGAKVNGVDELRIDRAGAPWPSTRKALGVRIIIGMWVPESYSQRLARGSPTP